MALTDKLNAAYEERMQLKKVNHARALMQPIRADILRVDRELQEIADSGVLDDVDNEIKQGLMSGWNVIKAANVGFQEAVLDELLNWSP